MPSIQCDNGKWKWGENGSCIYDSKKESDDANSDYKNITIVSGPPCSGKNTYVKNNKNRGDVVWDFDKIHSALTDESTHNHIEQVRKYIFSMRETFYNDLQNENELKVWIINSSPIKSVRNELAEKLNANIIYLKRTKDECLNVANNERPDEWKGYIENYFDRFEEIEENENIKIIEIKAISDIDFTPTQGMIDEAKKGKEWREEFGRGGTEVGLKTANMIISNSLSADRVTRMYSYLQRHEVDKQGEGFSPDEDGFPSAGRIAWALWGGDAAVKWSERKRNEIIAEEKKDERNLKNYNQMEKRIFNIETRVDSTEDGRDLVVGHASVYDSRSNNLGGFYEFIERGAFTEELIANSDVRALINHDPNLILARNTSGTLNLTADERGLKYEFEMPETSYGKDLAISMKRGDITQSSFAFTVAEDDWSTDEEGNNIRTIKKIDRLYDVSPVTYPAYNMAESDLVVAKRGLKEYQESLVEETKEEIIEEKENNLVRNSLVSLNIELKKRK